MNIDTVITKFHVKGNYLSHSIIGSGHINTTYLVETKSSDKNRFYILQKMNTRIFTDPVKLMDNIIKVTTHIKNVLDDEGVNYKRKVLRFIKTIYGMYIYYASPDEVYRCYKYVKNSVTFDEVNSLDVVYESGKAFGEFQNYLKDFDASTLNEIIPNFHNTIKRFETFKERIKVNLSNRLDNCNDIVNKYLELEDVATVLIKEYNQNNLPLRVTHNDTKCNNVVFDKNTHKHLAVIDLDTVMPGLVGNDFGDSIRFTCNSAKENERDLDKVYLDLDKFKAYTKGFLETVGKSLTENEIKLLPDSAIALTIECGVRFLTDYLDGDTYFKVQEEDENLVRAKCQLKLAYDMIDKKEEMVRIIGEILE